VAVGLGNPGSDYEGSRHNLGALAVRVLATRHHARLRTERGTSCETVSVRDGGKLLVLAVPQTYMNESGMAVRPLAKRYLGADPELAERLVIVHDELDLPPGTVRIKAGGGTAGHNGLRSIEAHLHRRDFLRVRIGIGKPPSRAHGVDHVLKRPTKAVKDLLDVSVEVAADAVEAILAEGVAAAMNRFNTRVEAE
jgi:PTH1 family peptidyl-tRNA hydrolase